MSGYTHLADRHNADAPEWFDPKYEGKTAITIEPYMSKRMVLHIAVQSGDIEARTCLMELLEMNGGYQWLEATGSQCVFKIPGPISKTAQLVQFEAFRQMAFELAAGHDIKLRHVGYICDPGIGLLDL